ncbi:hypothetical protein Aoki45_29770 [Algoriphagus sp. oki45]|uniref:DUF4221 family protein n=1 Tax=Algoriphagus sp. oki45 TaxID=3067294 RepID=UPI0027F28D0F|nr:hypothetical protein Aoki45_29770 [Algoriphagus sp. oki45]
MRLFLYAILLTLFVQCQTKTQSENLNPALVSSGEYISLSLDDSTSNISTGYQYFDAGEREFFFNLIWESNTLQVYDLSSGNKIKSLSFEAEGPSGVGDVFAFHVHSLDSIFLFSPPFGQRFHLANLEGQILKKFEYEIPEGGGSAFVHNAFMISPPVLEGSKLAVNHRFPQNMRELTGEKLAGQSFGYQIDLSTGETEYFAHLYPNDYLTSGLKSVDFSRAQGKNQIVYSLVGDHRVFVASSFEEEWKSVIAKSQFLDEALPSFNADAVYEEFQSYAFSSSRYGSILFDPYREVYYRIAFPTLSEASIADIRSLGNALGPFVVMVLDSDLKVITEKKFESGKYHPDNVFVGKKGLYLSLQHPNNPENREEEMQFELIELR